MSKIHINSYFVSRIWYLAWKLYGSFEKTKPIAGPRSEVSPDHPHPYGMRLPPDYVFN